MPRVRPRYVIYAPSFDENNGGAIFQHRLVHELNAMGEAAALCQWVPHYDISRRKRVAEFLKPTEFVTSPDLDTPVVKRSDIGPDTVVVYSEIIPGNPLRARNVARWLLYKPGLIHRFEFRPDEVFFRGGEMSDLPEVTGGAPDLTVWRRNRSYQDEQRPDRSGVCYIVRKGNKKPPIPETDGAIQIDGLSHAEINEVFNRSRTFISYDEATMYSQFAAICGCDSIVVPGLYATHDEWVANHPIGIYGVAYGFDALPHARATRSKVLGLLDSKERDSLVSIENFVAITKKRFRLQ